MVVAVGLTLVEPLADVDVNVPGVMAIVVAPVVAQFSVLPEPEVMLVGLAVKELIAGLLAGFTVTVSVDVDEPTAFVAVNVYVVVAAGLMLVEPLAEAEVNVPGVMAMLVAPIAVQFSSLLVPELMVAGFAVNDVIAGAEPFPEFGFEGVSPEQLARPAHEKTMRIRAQRSSRDEVARELSLFRQRD